jgi:uncharacterized protein GlcG (DUF336 family)
MTAYMAAHSTGDRSPPRGSGRLKRRERDGVLIGAIGVSGGDSAQDQRAVEAGAKAFAG